MSARLSRRQLVEKLGENLAYEIMESFGGHHIPQPGNMARLLRDREIRRRLSDGTPPEEIAATYRLSVRQILRIDQTR